MELRTDIPLSFPRARVFLAYRDRTPDLVRYLPNIRGFKQLSREERPGEVALVGEWKGGGEIPAMARSFVDESMLAWTDHATWKEAEWLCAWRTDIHAFPGALRCAGENRFVETREGARIEVRGDFTCDAGKIPGVPRLLSRTIGPAVEKFFVARIAENLAGIGHGIGKLLAKEPA